ncbi:hypothetical protein [Microbacterium sp. Se5.02b]|uniref:hypothetical protein n=1 Tax=Microbacterium sp. Se5.02b TaxID=2864103 RepID=UPI001C68A21C|nr:hypothetical protein [Microbacterium sp. Se5.02b]QYM64894.1 hypothetical protein K1X59_03185 [Microbacterium sp. Se5.02b]
MPITFTSCRSPSPSVEVFAVTPTSSKPAIAASTTASTSIGSCGSSRRDQENV